MYNESNLSLRIHPGDRDEAQDDAPSLPAQLCPQPWAQRCPWLKGPSGRGASSAGVGAVGQGLPRASPNLLQEVPVVLGPQRGLSTRTGDWRGPQDIPQPRVPRPPSHPVLSPSAFLGVTPAPNSRAFPQQPGRFRPIHGASRAGLGEVGSPGTQFRRGLAVPLREPGDRTQTLPRGSQVGAEVMIWRPNTRSNSEPLVPKSGKSSVEWH